MRRNVTPKGLYFDIFNFSYFYRYKSLKNFLKIFAKLLDICFSKRYSISNERLL